MAKFIKEVRPAPSGGISPLEIGGAFVGALVGLLLGNVPAVIFGFLFGAIVGMLFSGTGQQKLRFFAYNFPRLFAHPEGKIFQESEIPIDKADEALVAKAEELELKLQLANQKIEELQTKNKRKYELDIEEELARRQKKAPPMPAFSVSDIMKENRKAKDNPLYVLYKNGTGGAGWLHDIKVMSDKGRTAGVLIVIDKQKQKREFVAPSFEAIFQHPEHVQRQIEELHAITTNFLPDGSFLKDVTMSGINIGENPQLATVYVDGLLKENGGLKKEKRELENVVEAHAKIWGEMEEDVRHVKKENTLLKVENSKLKNHAVSQSQTTSAYGMQAMDGQTAKVLSDTVRRRQEAALKQAQGLIAKYEAKVENAEKSEELRDMFKLLSTAIKNGLGGAKEAPAIQQQQLPPAAGAGH